ncbi:YibE/F family protein [Cellulomonas massiliensis]|uniref:YibE/F family protein n=1 Tax=Cellulomonas massiliensis TaxID=1465811 RepID=UPI001FECC303|nr:YibE/F family protein [Cellulomonas massiliensis]
MPHDHAAHAPSSTVEPGVRRRARVLFAAVLLPALLATVVGWWLLRPTGEMPVLETTGPGQTFHTATVLSVGTDTYDQPVARATLDGVAVDVLVPPEYGDELQPGDLVRVVTVPDVAPGTAPYLFVDLERGPPLALLAVVFAVLVVAVARWRGLAALVGLGFSLVVVGTFTLPALVAGRPAAAVGLVTSSLIMFVVLYLAHGFSLRTSTALVGTLAGLGVTCAIAVWATGAAQLTGLSDEYAPDLRTLAPELRMREVLLCGMVLAGLGVLNDVTITQASAVWELHAGDGSATRRTLFARGMRIGRDHIASTVYTIVFAYVGATLPLVLLVAMSDRTLLGALSSGELAEEVARTLVGSIGLVLAIPLTTLVAVLAVGAAARPAGPGRPPADPAAVAVAGDPAAALDSGAAAGR